MDEDNPKLQLEVGENLIQMSVNTEKTEIIELGDQEAPEQKVLEAAAGEDEVFEMMKEPQEERQEQEKGDKTEAQRDEREEFGVQEMDIDKGIEESIIKEAQLRQDKEEREPDDVEDTETEAMKEPGCDSTLGGDEAADKEGGNEESTEQTETHNQEAVLVPDVLPEESGLGGELAIPSDIQDVAAPQQKYKIPIKSEFELLEEGLRKTALSPAPDGAAYVISGADKNGEDSELEAADKDILPRRLAARLLLPDDPHAATRKMADAGEPTRADPSGGTDALSMLAAASAAEPDALSMLAAAATAEPDALSMLAAAATAEPDALSMLAAAAAAEPDALSMLATAAAAEPDALSILAAAAAAEPNALSMLAAAAEPNTLSMLAAAAEPDALSMLAAAAAAEHEKENKAVENVWCDVGIVKGPTCSITSFYRPGADHDQEHEGLSLENLPDYSNSVRLSLEPGVAYKVRVAAVNSFGRGPWSEFTTFRTCVPGFPGTPSSIKISRLAEGALLDWDPPSDPAGTVEGYAVCLAVRRKRAVQPPRKQFRFIPVYTGTQNRTVVPNSSLAVAYIDRSAGRDVILFRILAKNEKGFGPATQVRWIVDS